MNDILFFLVIFFATFLQGITGFGGSALAMPFGLMLVGYGVAKPALSVVGLLGGLFIVITSFRHIDWKELGKILLLMGVGMAVSVALSGVAADHETTLGIVLGVFVLLLAARGIVMLYLPARVNAVAGKSGIFVRIWHAALLFLAGAAQGLFVSGGPLLVGYLADRMDDRRAFRVTLSAVWVITNVVTIVTDALRGVWSWQLAGRIWPVAPVLIVSMTLGSLLSARLPQKVFLLVTYGLLAVSGVLLLLR